MKGRGRGELVGRKKEDTNPNQPAGPPPPQHRQHLLVCKMHTEHLLRAGQPSGPEDPAIKTDQRPARGQPAARLLGSHAWVCMESPGEAAEKSAGPLPQRF